MARLSFIQPVAARVSSSFGVDRGDHAHAGTDFAAPCGSPVVASAAGRVSAANYSTTAGNLVHIAHGDGWQTRYFHLQRSVVGVGAAVAQGQLIGYVGSTGNSTGCHLHFEVRRNGVAVDPVAALQSGVEVSGAFMPPAAAPRPRKSSGPPAEVIALGVLLAILWSMR